ncbi:MAG: BCD family MFS transporter [Pseudomonadota bacterium]
MQGAAHLGWFGIFRLGLVQASLGAIFVLATSVINRVMQVELGLPAMLAGVLIVIHYAVQMVRPRMGYGADLGRRHTPWILGGMAVLACGGVLAAVGTALASTHLLAGFALAAVAFVTIGLGVGACGTVLLVLMAKRVPEGRRSAAATIIWTMMIAGFIVSTAVAGRLLDPFSLPRLIEVTAWIGAGAMLTTLIAMFRLEGPSATPTEAMGEDEQREAPAFGRALRQIWAEPQARLFTIFVFVSMFAYGAQDLILEPFAGVVFGMTAGESTLLTSTQNKGVLLGMLLIGIVCSSALRGRLGSVRAWTVGGCLASALALALLSIGGSVGSEWPLEANVFALGLANGVYAVAAITSMMQLASAGRARRVGVRMGLWGASQAIAMGVGMFLGTVAVDVVRGVFGSPLGAFASVFAAQAVIFLAAAALAARIGESNATAPQARPASTGSMPSATPSSGGGGHPSLSAPSDRHVI